MERVEGLLDRGIYKNHYWFGGQLNAPLVGFSYGATLDLGFLNQQISKGS